MAFAGKVILITGASSGIGAASAEYFAKEGALLSLVGRNAKKFEKVINNIKDSGIETEPLVILADVSIDAKRIVNETITKYGKLDVLINNAAFSIAAPIESIKKEDFDAIFATNVWGLIEITQLSIPYLIATKGNVVNVSSVVGMRAFRGITAYATSKAAVDHFTRCCAMELADKGVRVNSINPAVIDTDFHRAAGVPEDAVSTFLENYGKLHPIGRVGQPNEVVHAIAFVAHENASFITGAIIPVDGGLAGKGPTH